MFVILIVIGGFGIPAVSTSTGWATGALLLVLTFLYGMCLCGSLEEPWLMCGHRYHGRPCLLFSRGGAAIDSASYKDCGVVSQCIQRYIPCTEQLRA